MKRKPIKSANEDQFEIDETVIDEVSNAEEFADVEITNDDIMDAVEAIGALADAVIEKANLEEKEIDADELLDEVRDMIDETHDEEAEEEFDEDIELPEELVNSAVRVMVSEDGAISVEQTPDEVYDSNIDDMACTVFDTCDDIPVEVEETAEDPSDEVLVIGNSAAKKFRKGFVVLKSSTNKRAWSTAYRKVKKMIGNSTKMTAVHWAIVSALSAKEEENDKLKKKIECKLVKAIRSNKDAKAAFSKHFLKSSDEIDPDGQPIAETKPEEVAGRDNPGYTEEKPAEDQTSPEEVTSKSGNPVEDPDKEVENPNEAIKLPEEKIIPVEVKLTNSVNKIHLRKVYSSRIRNYNIYKVIENNKIISKLDGRVIRSGKIAFAFKNTSQGLLACAAEYVNSGNGNYKTVLKNNRIVIARGTETNAFSAAERIMIATKIASAREEGKAEGYKQGKIEAIRSSRKPVKSALSSDELADFARKVCRSIYRKTIDKEKAVQLIMKNLECNQEYAEDCLESWLSNPDYRWGSDNEELFSRRNSRPIQSAKSVGFFDENTHVYDDGHVEVYNGSAWTDGGTVKELDKTADYDGILEWFNKHTKKSNASQSVKRNAPARRPVLNGRPLMNNTERRPSVQPRQRVVSAIDNNREIESRVNERLAAEERMRLFQSSQAEMNDEKRSLKSSATRNSETLSKIYDKMF